ncbi:MAG: trypsin-like peptidase domain-containing protein [Tissierellia bacterium]|nr:trypsin-like peptidase domain-containing protein [Tissierellia bacterium]
MTNENFNENYDENLNEDNFDNSFNTSEVNSQNYDTYQNSYSENKPYAYSNRYEEKRRKPKGGAFKTIILALIFAILGGMCGSFYGYKMAHQRLGDPEAAVINQYTINPSDNVNTVAAVAQANLDSVVGITTKGVTTDMFLRPRAVQGTGSGVIVDEKGYILTNHHVIASLSNDNFNQSGPYAEEITVVLNDNTTLPGKVLWSEEKLDLAIVKVEPKTKLQAAKLGDSDKITIGEMAIAIGNPLFIDFKGSVTAGYISGLNRSVTISASESMEELIQTDASINKGNSGGPLLNAKGEVIGINTLKLQGDGLGFSIPINIAKPIIEQVINKGSYQGVYLGIRGASVEVFKQMGIDYGIDHGIGIAEVMKDSPASLAGLERNDVILAIDEKELNSMDELQKELYKYKVGDTVTLKIYRNGVEENLKLTFEESKDI